MIYSNRLDTRGYWHDAEYYAKRLHMRVRIYQPSKTAMQSGIARTKRWLLEPVAETDAREIEPLMGWTSSSDTTKQLHLSFPTKKAAIEFAEKRGFEYMVTEPKLRAIKPKSYAENFQ